MKYGLCKRDQLGALLMDTVVEEDDARNALKFGYVMMLLDGPHRGGLVQTLKQY